MPSLLSKPLVRRLALALLIIIAVVAVIGWFARPKPIPVVLKAVDSGKVESTVANTRAGTVEACQRTKLSTIMGGRIEFLGVKEGDKVKKGQLLMKLWNDDQQAQSAVAEAQRVTAEKRVTEACVVAANAEREAERQATLRQRGFVSSTREESARTDALARRAACNTAKADVAQAAARLQATKIDQGRTVLYAP
ncbi:MAG: efflux RND transporter periplasmic adaptor subunit, partial [Betaproteobacteria bacterium]